MMDSASIGYLRQRASGARMIVKVLSAHAWFSIALVQFVLASTTIIDTQGRGRDHIL